MDKYSMDYALTGQDIYNIVNDGSEMKGNPESCGIIEYGDLYNVDRLEQLMIDDNLVILYRSSPKSAHWCCIFKNQEGLNFFDPYGTVIDNEIDQIEHINPEYANDYYHGGKKRLIELILNGDYKDITYNNYKTQEMKNNINTCGRHVATRLLFKKYTLEEYVETLFKMSKEKYLDDIVLKITNKII